MRKPPAAALRRLPRKAVLSATYDAALRHGERCFRAQGIESARAEAEFLLAGILNISSAALCARLFLPAPASVWRRYAAGLAKRCAGMPSQYIIRRSFFYGLTLESRPGVFIPRPETELLVEQVLAAAGGRQARKIILDLCTGSGNIAIALTKELPYCKIYCSDISRRALKLTRYNIQQQQAAERITVVGGNLWRPFTAAGMPTFDIVVSNPPYVRDSELSRLPDIVRREPRRALAAGADGGDVIRAIVAQAPRHMNAAGWLFMEIGADQRALVQRIFRQASAFEAPEFKRDLAGLYRVVVARRMHG